MRLSLTMDLDNAAFGETGEDRAAEAARILHAAADRLDPLGPPDRGVIDVLIDSNGNSVGEVELSGVVE